MRERTTVSQAMRREVYDRDNGICGICGEMVGWPDLHVDHIHPESRGGGAALENLRTTHSVCNRGRTKDEYQQYESLGRRRLHLRVDDRTAEMLTYLQGAFNVPNITVLIQMAILRMAQEEGWREHD